MAECSGMTKPTLPVPNSGPRTGLYRILFEVGTTQQYYPLLHSVFWFEHTLWGDAVLGYHLINLVWHSIAVVLVYAILKRLRIPGALLAAAIFAIHPVMVESVAWISEQKNTLSAVLYLSGICCSIFALMRSVTGVITASRWGYSCSR